MNMPFPQSWDYIPDEVDTEQASLEETLEELQRF
jgi:hypothetical protein